MTHSLTSATSRNETLFQRAQHTIPGGVNSPVRAFKSVGGMPRFIQKAKGAYFWDADGKQYIDLITSWGPMIVGHAHPEVLEAVYQTMQDGFSFGAPTEREIEIAETLCRLLPSMDMVRLVSSGTEATMSALRLARGFTGRSKIIKFDGCYHGHADSLLVKAGSGLLTFGHPTSAGVPAELIQHTLVLPYHDAEALTQAFAEYADELAAVIIEPIAGNMNLVRPSQAYLQHLRDLCTQHGVVLIFDEVMSGFRVGLQGAQGIYNIQPDLTTLGKVIGGGMPVGAFGGRRDIMQHLAPLGAVYQAGTLSGNPVAVTAGLKTLEIIQRDGFYEQLANNTRYMVDGLVRAAHAAGIPFSADAIGGMFGVYFTSAIPAHLDDISASDIPRFNRFFHAMLNEGVYFAPSAYEAGFTSIQHTTAVMDEIITKAERVFAVLDEVAITV
jgi:glutamate-1-semialdehyde 2,1-aminomutase